MPVASKYRHFVDSTGLLLIPRCCMTHMLKHITRILEHTGSGDNVVLMGQKEKRDSAAKQLLL